MEDMMNLRAVETLTVAVGDIHGSLESLCALFASMERERACRGDDVLATAVFLGDYCDRGRNTKAVIDLLLDGLPGWNKVFLRGNHDAMLQDFLRTASLDQHDTYWWDMHGAAETVLSYCPEMLGELPSDPRDAAARLAEAMPARHHAFLDGLQNMYATADAYFVHAGFMPGAPPERSSPNVMHWVREEFLNSGFDFGRPVYHGHTPSQYGPEFALPYRVNCDTKAFGTGILTAAVVGEPGRFLVGVPAMPPGGRWVVAAPRQVLQPDIPFETHLRWSLDAAAVAGAAEVRMLLDPGFVSIAEAVLTEKPRRVPHAIIADPTEVRAELARALFREPDTKVVYANRKSRAFGDALESVLTEDDGLTVRAPSTSLHV